MKQLVRKVSHMGYGGVAKPLMFRISPDTVHHTVAQAAKIFQHIPGACSLVRAAWQHTSEVLAQDIHGLSFANPVGLAAGFDKNASLAPLMESVGFGFVTCGSITGSYCAGNEKPWFHRLPAERSLVVNAGLPNPGSAQVGRQLAKDRQVARMHAPLMVSVARTNTPASSTDEEAIADYVRGLKNLRMAATMFELNISCPNTYGGEPFTTPDRLDALLAKADSLKLTQPLFVKMPSNLPWPDYDKLLAVLVKHNVQGVTVSNLRKDRKGVAVGKNIKGNLSGAPTKSLSDALIRKTYTKYGDKLTIIGVGGVFTAADAYDKIRNGASLVALVTGLIYEGPQVIGQINKDLESLLRADGYTHISQAVGSAVDRYDTEPKS